MPDLLIELFSEEIPARMQAKAADDLKRLVTDGLVAAGLTYAGAAAFAPPRRLALSIDGLLGESKPLREERKGPKVGAPDPAIDGFLRGAGVAREDLEVRDDKKGQVYFAVIEKPGRMAADIIAIALSGLWLLCVILVLTIPPVRRPCATRSGPRGCSACHLACSPILFQTQNYGSMAGTTPVPLR